MLETAFELILAILNYFEKIVHNFEKINKFAPFLIFVKYVFPNIELFPIMTKYDICDVRSGYICFEKYYIDFIFINTVTVLKKSYGGRGATPSMPMHI